MPVLETTCIWLWPDLCEKRFLSGNTVFATSRQDNILIQILSGNPTLIHSKGRTVMAPGMILYLSRRTEVTLSSGECTEISLLRLRHTNKVPRYDLNYICTMSAHVDSLFSVKPYVTVLQDNMFIHASLSAIRYELHHRESDWEMMVTGILNELMIKLARCYHSQQKFSGIGYITKARSYIQERYSEPITVQEIAEYTGISRSHLSCLFSKNMSRSIVEYINTVRCEKAALLLGSTQFPVIDIAIEVGFNSRQHFTRTFTRLYGVSPQEYRRKYRQSPHDISG